MWIGREKQTKRFNALCRVMFLTAFGRICIPLYTCANTRPNISDGLRSFGIFLPGRLWDLHDLHIKALVFELPQGSLFEDCWLALYGQVHVNTSCSFCLPLHIRRYHFKVKTMLCHPIFGFISACSQTIILV